MADHVQSDVRVQGNTPQASAQGDVADVADVWEWSAEDLDLLARHDLSKPDAAWNFAAEALRATADTLDAMVVETATNLVEIEVWRRRIDQINEENRKGLERLLSGAGP